MAMPFGNEPVERAYGMCFKPAVARAGFHLVRADEDAGAGSIDDHIRVAIRTSKLVVADLTDANLGAYWEAGFAEGLGVPVIYTCERTFFEDPGTHFDTRNLRTVVWDADALAVAEQQLVDTIRATLPGEARMEDA